MLSKTSDERHHNTEFLEGMREARAGIARLYLCAAGTAMHKTPKDIARSLRVFRNAHRLGLLRCVRILPGKYACDAAMAQEEWNTSAMLYRACRLLNARALNVNVIMFQQRSSSEWM